MTEKKVYKKDFILLAVILAAALLIWLGYRASHSGSGTTVQITVDGENYGSYDLESEQEIPITIDGTVTNILVISGGKADMVSADCPDKLCVNQKAISKNGETIVCLPNKVVAEVVSTDPDQEIDAIVK